MRTFISKRPSSVNISRKYTNLGQIKSHYSTTCNLILNRIEIIEEFEGNITYNKIIADQRENTTLNDN